MNKYNAILFFLCIFGTLLFAADQPQSPQVITTDICTFNLYGYDMPKTVKKAIDYGVTIILDTYKHSFGFEFPEDFKVTVTIIEGQDNFKNYQKKKVGKIISESGYFSPGDGEGVIWSNESPEEMISILFHEMNHFILMSHVPWAPHWVNEGLSEYFEQFNVLGKYKRVYLNQIRHSWVKHWAIDGFPIEPEKYFSLSYEQWQKFFKKDPNAAYTIGYSMVYFMMSSDVTKTILKDILHNYAKEGPKVNSLQVINDTFPGGFRRLEKLWQKWIPKARKYRPIRAARVKDKEKENIAKKGQQKNSAQQADK